MADQKGNQGSKQADGNDGDFKAKPTDKEGSSGNTGYSAGRAKGEDDLTTDNEGGETSGERGAGSSGKSR